MWFPGIGPIPPSSAEKLHIKIPAQTCSDPTVHSATAKREGSNRVTFGGQQDRTEVSFTIRVPRINRLHKCPNPYTSLYLHSVQCAFTVHSFKRSSLFPHILNLGWSSDLLWQTEMCQKQPCSVPSLGLMRPCMLLLFSLDLFWLHLNQHGLAF